MSGSNGHKQRFTRLRSQSGAWLVDPGLRARLVADADADGSSMTAVVIRILADIYRTPVSTSGRTGKPSSDNDVIVLLIPDKLDRKIAMNAGAHGRTPQDEIRVALSSHYGLPIPAKPPLTRKPRRPAAV